MKRTDINDDELVKMYNANTPIPELMSHFKTGHTVIYAHLKKAGAATHRRAPHSWTEKEEATLVKAWANNATGQDYIGCVPNRSMASCKGHLNKMRREKRLHR